MPLNLIKLCVGVDSLDDLENWVNSLEGEHIHTTRMTPKRKEELLDGGSLYWVIKGKTQCRQRLKDLRPFTDNEGIARCAIVMEKTLIPTLRRPVRAFQGWRYLPAHKTPQDKKNTAPVSEPTSLTQELRELGLI